MLPDKRNGLTMKPELYYELALAFSKKDFMRTGGFRIQNEYSNRLVDLAYRMQAKGIGLKLLSSVIIYKNTDEKNIKRLNNRHIRTVKKVIPDEIYANGLKKA